MDNIFIYLDEFLDAPKYIPVITSNLNQLIDEILFRIDGIEVAGFTLFDNGSNINNIEKYIKKVENSDIVKDNVFNSEEYINDVNSLKNLTINLNEYRNKYKFLRNYLNESQKKKFFNIIYDIVIKINKNIEKLYELKIKISTIENTLLKNQLQTRQDLIMHVYDNLSNLSKRQRQKEIVNIKEIEYELSKGTDILNKQIKNIEQINDMVEYYKNEITYMKYYSETKDSSYLLMMDFFIGGIVQLQGYQMGDPYYQKYTDSEILTNMGINDYDMRQLINDERITELINQLNNRNNQNNMELENLMNENNIFMQMIQYFTDNLE